jgi:cysteinyl-tRNA synthetase
LDWTAHSVEQAKNILDRWYGALRGMPEIEDLPDCEPHVMAALLDDLNIPLAIAQLHEIVAEIYQTTDLTEKQDLQALLKASANMLGFLEDDADTWFQELKAPQSVGALSVDQINALIQQRIEARVHKDFKTSDAIRLQLEQHGVILEDGPQGTTWRYK